MEGLIVYIRKIAVAAGFATGAALALAPLASADTPITSTVESEIASLNSLFDSQVALAGLPATDITTNSAGFDVVPLADAPQATVPADLTPLDYLLYGVNPIQAGIASDPGSFVVLNGALGKFDDAYNVLLYSALNNGAIDPNDADFIGSASSIDHAQSLLTATDAAQYFFNFGVGDLEGYLGIFPAEAASTAAADPAAAFDITPTLTSEITSLNGLFGLDASLAGVSGDIIPGTGALPFDTIDPSDTNSIFDTLVFGAAGPSLDPGSYDVFNGALGEFDNAYNVGLFSLLDPTGAFDPTDIIGTHADLLNGTVSEAISGFLQLGLSDLAGYFVPAI
jgi:hypothetical protein